MEHVLNSGVIFVKLEQWEIEDYRKKLQEARDLLNSVKEFYPNHYTLLTFKADYGSARDLLGYGVYLGDKDGLLKAKYIGFREEGYRALRELESNIPHPSFDNIPFEWKSGVLFNILSCISQAEHILKLKPPTSDTYFTEDDWNQFFSILQSLDDRIETLRKILAVDEQWVRDRIEERVAYNKTVLEIFHSFVENKKEPEVDTPKKKWLWS